MKPVHQNIFGSPNGNCFQACVASIFELPLEDVPHFCGYKNKHWFQDIQRWMNERGFFYFPVCFSETNLEYETLYPILPDVLCIASGKSPRGNFNHSVVGVIRSGYDFRILYDPHPDNTGLDGKPETLEFFVAINPALFLTIK